MRASELAEGITRRLHAGHTWLARGAFSCPEDLGLGAALQVLGGEPVSCADVRAAAEGLHEARGAREREVLLVDNSVPTSWGCAACVLGADVVWEELGEGLAAVSLSRLFLRARGEKSQRLRALLDERCLDEGELLLDGPARDAQAWRLVSDEAQVVAAFLSCHPCVGEVRYPGLRGDPSFAVAARTLQGGFGPLVDFRRTGDASWTRVVCDGQDIRGRILSLEAALRG